MNALVRQCTLPEKLSWWTRLMRRGDRWARRRPISLLMYGDPLAEARACVGRAQQGLIERDRLRDWQDLRQ